MRLQKRIALAVGLTLLIITVFYTTIVVLNEFFPVALQDQNLPQEELTSETEPTSTQEPAQTPAPIPTSRTITIKRLNLLTLHQINVGCADAYLIEVGEHFIMVDGGLAEDREKVISYLKNAGVDKLYAYVATHWHGDHVDNLTAILEKFGDNNTIVFGPSRYPSPNFPIPNGKGNYKQMVDGDVYQVGELTIKCMGPYKLEQGGNCNYDSLNFLMQFGTTRILMTGDYIHKEILKSYGEELKNIDVYKMAHHGLKVSDYSGNTDVLKHLNPKIILVPANSSSPTQDLVETFNLSSKIYDNKNGNIKIISNGNSVSVTTGR